MWYKGFLPSIPSTEMFTLKMVTAVFTEMKKLQCSVQLIPEGSCKNLRTGSLRKHVFFWNQVIIFHHTKWCGITRNSCWLHRTPSASHNRLRTPALMCPCYAVLLLMVQECIVCQKQLAVVYVISSWMKSNLPSSQQKYWYSICLLYVIHCLLL